MEGVGAKIKKVRLEKGLSLDDVRKKTKIHLNILRAIEEDNYINFNPIYIKGFIKLYCRFLGVDPRDYISDYKETPKAPLVIKPQPKDDKIAISRVNAFRPPINIKAVVAVIAVIAVVFGLYYIGKVASKHKFSAKPKAAAVTSQKKKPAPATLPAPASGVISLIIRAKEDCWARVKTDGHLVFQSIIKRGRLETWKAKEKIEISLGNASGVSLSVNGKIVSNLGKRGQVLKNIIITKEGINIPQ